MCKARFIVTSIIVILISVNTVAVASMSQNYKNGMTRSHPIAETQTDLTGITVGIYDIGYYDERVNESRTALISMFEWMNATVRIFNTTDIINGSLWACEVLSIPEGLGPTLEHKLTDEGLDAIRDWIAAGGSYIGVRGSASIAVQYSYFEGIWTEFDFAVINGTSYQMTDIDSRGMTNVSINHDLAGPDLSSLPENMSVLFITGRYVLPNEGQELIYIANYTHNNLPAMVASSYGEGNVFISSPHFEYEENDSRDGTDYMDEYNDPDSEWPLLLEISKWLVESSPTVQNLTEWPTNPPPSGLNISPEILLLGSSIGVVLLLVAVVYVKKR
ncbi:MAG: hypothetical protein ACFFFO_09700 [Candidatus Thorarchaeota archaeon]